MSLQFLECTYNTVQQKWSLKDQISIPRVHWQTNFIVEKGYDSMISTKLSPFWDDLRTCAPIRQRLFQDLIYIYNFRNYIWLFSITLHNFASTPSEIFFFFLDSFTSETGSYYKKTSKTCYSNIALFWSLSERKG